MDDAESKQKNSVQFDELDPTNAITDQQTSDVKIFTCKQRQYFRVDIIDLTDDASCTVFPSFDINTKKETGPAIIMDAEPEIDLEEKNIHKGELIKDEPDGIKYVNIDDADDMEDTKLEENYVNTFNRDTTTTYCKEEPDEQDFKGIADLELVMCDKESFATKEEPIENAELDIKEELSHSDNIQMDSNECYDIDFGKEDDLLVSKSRLKPKKNINTECSIEASSQNGAFAFCNDCCKAFYRGFSFVRKPNDANSRTKIWKCSKQPQGCQVEITLFLVIGSFLEIGDHSCTSHHIVNQQHVFSKILLIVEERCSTAFHEQRFFTRYMPLKKVISRVIPFLNDSQLANTVQKMDDNDPTTIMYYLDEKGKRMAFYMGHTHITDKINAKQLRLKCKIKSCPGKFLVLRPDKAIALIHTHNCKTQTTELQTTENADDLKNYEYVTVFDNRHTVDTYDVQKRAGRFPEVDPRVDPKDSSILMFLYNEAHETLVNYKGHQYLSRFVCNSSNEWKCRDFQRCTAMLKITKDNKAVIRIGDHSCDQIDNSLKPGSSHVDSCPVDRPSLENHCSPESKELSVEVKLDKYMPIKLVSYLLLGPKSSGVPYNSDVKLPTDFSMPVFYHNSDKSREEVHHMGYEYLKKKHYKTRSWICTQYATCRAELNISRDRHSRGLNVQADKHSCAKVVDVLSDNSKSTFVAHASLKGSGKYTGTDSILYLLVNQRTIPKVNSKDSSLVLYYLNNRRAKIAYYMGYDYVFFCSVKEYTEWRCVDDCTALLRISSDERMAARCGLHRCRKKNEAETRNEIVDLLRPAASKNDYVCFDNSFLPVKIIFLEDQLCKTLPSSIPNDTIAYYYKSISNSRKYVALYRGHQYLLTGWNKRYYTWNCEHLLCLASLLIRRNEEALTVGLHTCQNNAITPSSESVDNTIIVGLNTCQNKVITPSSDSVNTAKILWGNYTPVKILSYMNHKICYEVESKLGKLPQVDPSDSGTAVYFYKNVAGSKRKVVLYMGHIYSFPQSSVTYIFYKCRNTCCPATLRIQKSEKGILVVGKHTCNKTKDSTLAKPLVANTRNQVVILKESIDVKHEINEIIDIDDIVNTKNNAVAVPSDYLITTRNIIVLSYSTYPQPVAPEEQTRFQILESGDTIAFRSFIHVVKLEPHKYGADTCRCPCINMQKSKCTGAVIINNHVVVAFVEHTCDKLNRSIPYLDPNDDTTMLLYNTALEKFRVKYHGFNYYLICRQEKFSIWQCAEGGQCAAKLQFFFFTKTIRLIGEHLELMTQNKSFIGDVELKDYCFRVFPRINDHRYIRVFNERLQPHLIYNRFIYSPGQTKTGWRCIHKDSYNCSGGIYFAEGYSKLSLKHTCLPESRKEKLLRIFRGDRSSKYVFYQSYLFRKKNEFRGREVVVTWQCMTDDCENDLTTVNGKVMSDAMHICGRPAIEVGLDIYYMKTASPPMSFEAGGKHYLFKQGYLYQGQSKTEEYWPCVHKEDLDCQGHLKFTCDCFLISKSGHSCFGRSENIMFFQHMRFRRPLILYGYFRNYLYKRMGLSNNLHPVFKWSCMMPRCPGILTTKFGKVVAASSHTCQISEDIQIKADESAETDGIVLSDDSDSETENEAKKLKVEHADDDSQFIEIDDDS